MSKFTDERYDEIKKLVNRSRFINEQMDQRINVAKSIENEIDKDTEYETANTGGEEKEESAEDKVQKYRISGGILALHGKERDQLQITTDDKTAFQETMDDFIE